MVASEGFDFASRHAGRWGCDFVAWRGAMASIWELKCDSSRDNPQDVTQSGCIKWLLYVEAR